MVDDARAHTTTRAMLRAMRRRAGALAREARARARATTTTATATATATATTRPRGLMTLSTRETISSRAAPWTALTTTTAPTTTAPTTTTRRGARTMFIQTQTTPNPMSLMFQPGREVYAEGSKNFSNAREAMASPLAKRLFAIEGVTNVFFGIDFVTVTKGEDAEWETVKPQTFEAITNFYASGETVMDEEKLAASGTAIAEDDDEIVAMIKELLETRIRPAVAEDGGDIVFKAFDPESGLVTVQLQGSCDGCPSSSVTLKSGIENMLMHYVPEVKGVVQAGQDDGEMDLLDLADLHRGRK